VVVLLACGASSVSAQTQVANYGNNLNGRGSTIEVGETIEVSLRPSNSGSTGYHWRVAKRPKPSVLRLVSSRTVDGTRPQQVFTYRARGAGAASLNLQYVSPGSRRRVTKRFRHTVAVNRPVPQLDCNGSSRRVNLLAQSGAARVFKVRRTIRLFSFGAGKVVRRSYDVFLGCASANGRTHELGSPGYTTSAPGPDAGRNELFNLTLRGTVVGYAFDPGCPFEVEESTNCTSEPGPIVAANDLSGGKLIRSTFVSSHGPDAYNRIAGLVVSPTGGLAWTEVAPTSNLVRRSDAPAEPGEAFANDEETIASGAGIDPDSLYFDGTNIEWREAGRVQRARLR
jgi:hypothetical protein